MKTKDTMEIQVLTHPNGYSLKVNQSEFMYFNLVDLMAGFMAHVGLGESETMDRGTCLSSLMAAMLGDAYTESVTTLKQRVGLLTNQYNTTIERMDKAIEFVAQAEKTITGLLKRLDDLEFQIKGTESEHANNKKVVDGLYKKLSEMDKKSDTIANQLANSATIMKAIEETKKKGKKTDKEGCDKPSKSVEVDGKPEKTTRQKRDEAILKKAEENPNIK